MGAFYWSLNKASLKSASFFIPSYIFATLYLSSFIIDWESPTEFWPSFCFFILYTATLPWCLAMIGALLWHLVQPSNHGRRCALFKRVLPTIAAKTDDEIAETYLLVTSGYYSSLALTPRVITIWWRSLDVFRRLQPFQPTATWTIYTYNNSLFWTLALSWILLLSAAVWIGLIYVWCLILTAFSNAADDIREASEYSPQIRN
jgi:hypothetical protein